MATVFFINIVSSSQPKTLKQKLLFIPSRLFVNLSTVYAHTDSYLIFQRIDQFYSFSKFHKIENGPNHHFPKHTLIT